MKRDRERECEKDILFFDTRQNILTRTWQGDRKGQSNVERHSILDHWNFLAGIFDSTFLRFVVFQD